MARGRDFLTVVIRIGTRKNEIGDLIDKHMNEEVIIAQRKWGVSLSYDEIQGVFHHAKAQLIRQTSDYTGFDWDGGNKVMLKVMGRSGVIKLPDRSLASRTEKLLKTRKEWIVDSEESPQAVSYADLPSHIRNHIFDMARTAVFYGVGSYS